MEHIKIHLVLVLFIEVIIISGCTYKTNTNQDHTSKLIDSNGFYYGFNQLFVDNSGARGRFGFSGEKNAQGIFFPQKCVESFHVEKTISVNSELPSVRFTFKCNINGNDVEIAKEVFVGYCANFGLGECCINPRFRITHNDLNLSIWAEIVDLNAKNNFEIEYGTHGYDLDNYTRNLAGVLLKDGKPSQYCSMERRAGIVDQIPVGELNYALMANNTYLIDYRFDIDTANKNLLIACETEILSDGVVIESENITVNIGYNREDVNFEVVEPLYENRTLRFKLINTGQLPLHTKIVYDFKNTYGGNYQDLPILQKGESSYIIINATWHDWDGILGKYINRSVSENDVLDGFRIWDSKYHCIRKDFVFVDNMILPENYSQIVFYSSFGD